MKEERGLVVDKQIVGGKFLTCSILIFILTFVVIAFIVHSFIYSSKCEIIKKIEEIFVFNISDILNFGITWGMISISIFPILIENIDMRILGISYKVIFFKNIPWKVMNYTKVSVIVLESMLFSIFFSFLESSIYVKAIEVILLIIIILGSLCILYLSYIAVIKTSKIYVKILKRIKSNPEVDNDVVKVIRKKLIRFPVTLPYKGEKNHDTYIEEEIGVLLFIAALVHGQDNEFYERIIKEIIYKIEKDSMERNKVFEEIIEKGNEEFEKKDSKQYKEKWENYIKKDLERKMYPYKHL